LLRLDRPAVAINDLTDQRHELSAIELKAVWELRAKPGDLRRLAATLGCPVEPVLARLVDLKLVVPGDVDESRKFTVKRVDIETCTHCNARCLFCPQSEMPKRKHVMALDLFERAVREIAPHHPDWVSLNQFSEPLLDPYFMERCRLLEAHGLKAALFTNATVLGSGIAEYLGKSQVLYGITVNFPSDDPEEWGNLMHLPARTHQRTVANIIALAESYQGGIGIVVNGLNDNQEQRIERIAALFSRFPNVSVIKLSSNTLAGNIQNELVGPASLVKAPKMAGCARLAAHVHISAHGDVFMCCLDYSQEFKFGNIAEAPLDQILAGNIASDHRAQVYGLTDADPGLLCRKCCHIRISQ
jgi:sulfatase maturation enzyme AslB (radical SAM superfamily)